MVNLSMGFIMILCYVPIVLVMFFWLYPGEWKNKKYLFGVRNREEFQKGETAEKIEEIAKRIRKEVFWVMMISCILAVLLLFIPGMTAMMIAYTVFILLGLFLFYLPYVKGNSELKSIKKQIGIEAKEGIKYADLKSIQASRALNIGILFFPVAVSALECVFSLLYDLRIINIGRGLYQGSYIMTILTGTFLFTSFCFIPGALMMDRMRNEVISKDSDVNVNYNRAKKKIWADVWTAFLWINAAAMAGCIAGFLMDFPELFFVWGCGIYLLVFFAAIALLAGKFSSLNKLYSFDALPDDDDDHWIFGMLYYNRKDGRLNVEKRSGIGMTVNMAHPVGKLILGFAALCLIASIVALVLSGVMENTKIDLRMEDGAIVCHHLRDEYRIELTDIREITFENDMTALRMRKMNGFESEDLRKGTFAVQGERSCRVFLDLKAGCCIRIVTDKGIYYISDATGEETAAFYRLVQKGD